KRQDGENEAEDAADGSADRRQAFALVAIGEDAAEGSEQKREKPRECHEADPTRRAGEMEGEPASADHQRPVSQAGQGRRKEQSAVVGEAEGREVTLG